MDARRALAPLVCLAAFTSLGASYRTANFVVEAPTPESAQQVGDTAEKFRHDLALEWLGDPMPNWSRPCPIRVQLGEQLGAGGATSFMFDRGEVYGWEMDIQGSLERVLDSVLPHEVTHTIFASHFRQPLPRWADEGACTTVEHTSERRKQQKMLIDFLQTSRGIAFNKMFAMRDYPRDVLPLYAQGHSLTSFFIDQGGRKKFLAYVGAGLQSGNWVATTQEYYGFQDLSELQDTWLLWVGRGSPSPVPTELSRLDRAPRHQLASNAPSESDVTVRGQSPDNSVYAAASNPDADPYAGRAPSPVNDDLSWQASNAPAPPVAAVNALAALTPVSASTAQPADLATSANPSTAIASATGPNSERRTLLEWRRENEPATASHAASKQSGALNAGGPSVYDVRATTSGTMLR